jgi:beta-lactamase superfamily II metal-dependent hydrolase
MKHLWTLLFCILTCTLIQAKGTKASERFVLWQLPTQVNDIGNSFVVKTDDGKIIVIDGGVEKEEGYLRGFIGALGNKVDCWFVSHPHADHYGALLKILENPREIRISKIVQSTFSDSLLSCEQQSKAGALRYYNTLEKSGIPVIEATAGMTFKFGHTTFKILGIKNEDLRMNAYNNSSMIIRIWDASKSVVLLGDAGKEEGDKLLKGPYRNELNCDYLQMAHHGQQGVSMDFYRTVKFKVCLWSTPTWVYNNDIGRGFNTHILKTIETRNTIKDIGIKKQYFSFEGLNKIE